MTEIPEHLLKRAQSAREKLSPPHPSGQLPKINAPLEDAHELAGLIDITSSDVCNLGAVAIRHELDKRLTTANQLGDEPAQWLRKRQTLSNVVTSNTIALSGFIGHREVMASSGVLEAIEYTGNRWLVAHTYQKLSEDSVVALAGWYDGPVSIKNGLFGSKAEQLELSRRKTLPYAIGFVSVAAQESTPLFMPLLKSVKASNGCHLVFPDGREINDESYNKPYILNKTMEALEAAPELTLAESIEKFTDIANQSGDEDMVVKMRALSLLNDNDDTEGVESQFLRLHLNQAGKTDSTGIVGRTAGIDTIIAGGNHQLMYEMRSTAWEKAPNNIMRTSYTIFGTIDPEKYGEQESAKRRFPRYIIYVDELFGVEALRYRSDGITTEPTDEQDSKDIRQLLNLMTERRLQEEMAERKTR